MAQLGGITALLVILGIFSVPSIYKHIAGFENGKPGCERPLRALQCFGSFVLAALILIRRDCAQEGGPLRNAAVVFLSIAWLEIGTRLFFKTVGTLFQAKSALGRVESLIWERSNSLGEYFWIEEHPFLQFTGLRGITPDGDYALGFDNITLADIPKREGVLRIACLGNSTSLDGYPERLQEYLNSCAVGHRFEVLNFGVGWWTSLHTMLNFVLNVREFRPDVLVVHENCNDEKYRGYPGLRGDCTHAMEVFRFKHHRDEWLYRFSLLYRLAVILTSPISRREYYRPKVSVGMRSGKTSNYVAEELQLFRRNIQTICTLAAADGIRVVLSTMPFSTVWRYTDVDEVRFDPHLREANSNLRILARANRAQIVDLERTLAGRDDLFWDKFHLTSEGAELKALETGKVVLRLLGIHPTADDHWREVQARLRSVDHEDGTNP